LLDRLVHKIVHAGFGDSVFQSNIQSVKCLLGLHDLPVRVQYPSQWRRECRLSSRQSRELYLAELSSGRE
jgi:hypothetical protein